MCFFSTTRGGHRITLHSLLFYHLSERHRRCWMNLICICFVAGGLPLFSSYENMHN